MIGPPLPPSMKSSSGADEEEMIGPPVPPTLKSHKDDDDSDDEGGGEEDDVSYHGDKLPDAIKILKIWTPEIITIIVLKWDSLFLQCCDMSKRCRWGGNSVDPG